MVEVDSFWEEKEREIKGKVIHKCLAEYLDGYREFSGPLWAYSFLLKKLFIFKLFQRKIDFPILWGQERQENQKNCL